MYMYMYVYVNLSLKNGMSSTLAYCGHIPLVGKLFPCLFSSSKLPNLS